MAGTALRAPTAVAVCAISHSGSAFAEPAQTLRKHILPAALTAVITALAFASTAAAQNAKVGIGIADIGTCALSTDPTLGCPNSPPSSSYTAFQNYQSLAQSQSGGANRFKYAEYVVPWDADYAIIDGVCQQDQANITYYGGPPQWDLLTQWYTAATRAGLIPFISLGEDFTKDYAGGAGANPKDNNPVIPDPDTTNTADPQLNQYYCGFKHIVEDLKDYATRNGLPQPTEWGVFNEPDSAPKTGLSIDQEPWCVAPPHNAQPPYLQPRNYSGVWGGAQCAAYFYDAAAKAENADNYSDTLVAGQFNWASSNDWTPNTYHYIYAYDKYLLKQLEDFPAVFSIHPYEDPAAAAWTCRSSCDLASNVAYAECEADNGANYCGSGSDVGFEDSAYVTNEIETQFADAVQALGVTPQPPQPQIWLESANWLNLSSSSYGNGAWTNAGCGAEPNEPGPLSLGACMDNSVSGEAYAALDFLLMPGTPKSITREYWWQFDSAPNHPTPWDSGLLSPGDQMTDPSKSDFEYERASFCVLAGESVGAALNDPNCNNPAGASDSQDSTGS